MPLDPRKAAAIAYAVYGVVYLAGALVELTPERMVTQHGIPYWVWYVLGGIFVVVLPIFVARGVRWLTALLCLGTGGKALWLFWLQGRHVARGEPTSLYSWFFALVAVGACLLLLRAFLSSRESRESR